MGTSARSSSTLSASTAMNGSNSFAELIPIRSNYFHAARLPKPAMHLLAEVPSSPYSSISCGQVVAISESSQSSRFSHELGKLQQKLSDQ